MQTDPLDQLSFSETTPQAVDLWAANLPLVNAEATADQLLTACQEISRLDIDAILRFELLNTLRPLVHYICSRLHRSATPNAITANTLAAGLAEGYGKCFEYCRGQDLDDKECRDILARSGHRLFAEMGRLALYSAQRYQDLPQTHWQEMHQAYSFLEQHELTATKLLDTSDSETPSSISQVYLRNLLFACCKHNQLNQQDLLYTFNALENWAAKVSLEQPTSDDLLLVDLASNSAPGYQHQLKKRHDLRALKTEILCYEAEAYVNDVNNSLSVPEYMTPRLITHLVQAWSVVQPRNYRRFNSNGRVRLCLGLRAVHYFLAGGVAFNEQISNSEAALRREVNPFLDVDYEPVNTAVDDDPWSQAHDLRVRIPENPNIENPEAILQRLQPGKQEREPAKFDHFELVSLDTSPGGYRLQWQESMPSGIQVGDLVGLRDENDARWCVAVLRWISRHGEHGEIGLELLAPRAIPVAVRPIQKKGGATNYARGLLLPGLEAIGQPPTMITPRLPFKASQKINIQRQGLQSTGMLVESLLNTESFNQFSFRMLDGYLENSGQNRNMDPLSAMTREDSTRRS